MLKNLTPSDKIYGLVTILIFFLTIFEFIPWYAIIIEGGFLCATNFIVALERIDTQKRENNRLLSDPYRQVKDLYWNTASPYDREYFLKHLPEKARQRVMKEVDIHE